MDEYAVIQKDGALCFTRLIEQVNHMISEGWEPLGGVCFVERSIYVGVAQAMIRRSPMRTNEQGHE